LRRYHIGRRDQAREIQITQAFDSVLHPLHSVDRFLAGINVAEAKGVDLKNGHEKGGDKGCRDKDFNQGSASLTAGPTGEYHLPEITAACVPFSGLHSGPKLLADSGLVNLPPLRFSAALHYIYSYIGGRR
jgi:hypothetical protein